jgi:hypothetical protein
MNRFSRMMTAKSRFTASTLIVPTLPVGMHPVTLCVTPNTRPTPEETHSVGAAEGCDLLILMPSNFSDISFKTPGYP